MICLDNCINYAFSQMSSFIHCENGINFIFDPNDQSRVVGHYGETHLCAAMLYYAERCGQPSYVGKALELLDGILTNWDDDKKASDYHADFNNFALSLIYRRLKTLNLDKYSVIVADKLMHTSDSKNRTVNWLPLRAYSNLQKYVISGNSKYYNIAVYSLKNILSAQYEDGLFDDMSPKGESFNLQYCIATAAALCLIYNHFAEYIDMLPQYDICKTMSTLYSLVLPDGDINYMGRGCNQIFAWGPWIYLTSKYTNTEIAGKSLSYLFERIDLSCNNCNLMLNDYNGKDKILWWDYHHYSVYMSHFLLWNELSQAENKHKEIIDFTESTDSGLKVWHCDGYSAVTFNGRRHYLVEKGPSIVALWSKENGALFKCGHSASNGMFSNRYFNPLSAFLNHFGFVEIEQFPQRKANKYVRKVNALFSKSFSIQIKPIFSEFQVIVDKGNMVLEADIPSISNCYFVFPTYIELLKLNVSFYIDDIEFGFRQIGTTQSQYGETYINIVAISKGQKCKLVLF